MELDIHDHAPEHKAGIADSRAFVTHDEMMRVFEAFKAENDAREAAEQRGRGDVLNEEKVARIERRLDELTLKSARPALAAERAAPLTHDAIEHKTAFHAYVRNGESGGLRALEQKAMSVTSGQDGGYTVPVEIETTIGRRLSLISPIRGIAGHREISGNVYRKPFMVTGPAVGWIGETGARPQTNTPVIDALNFPAMELYAQPAATAALLEDSAVNIDEWIASEVEHAFAVQEGAAFVSGDGENKPRGFLDYDTIDNAEWEWGKLGTVPTGADGGFPAENPSDVLIDLVYALKAGYRQNAHFVMNRKTQAAIRKFKDEGGNYLWQPPSGAGQRASLMTFPVVEAEDMPDMDEDSLSVAFGDFGRGYLVVDRQGVRVLRDPFTAKPYVLFYTTKRVGGGVQDFDAIKLLQFSGPSEE